MLPEKDKNLNAIEAVIQSTDGYKLDPLPREALQYLNYRLSLQLSALEMIVHMNGVAGTKPEGLFEPLIEWEVNPQYDSGILVSNVESRMTGFLLPSQGKGLSLPLPTLPIVPTT